MFRLRTNAILNVCIFVSLLVLYHALYTQNSAMYKNSKRNPKDESKYLHTQGSIKIISTDYNIWLIFTKVTNVSTLSYRFHYLLHNLINISTVPLKFNIIVDRTSQNIAENQIADLPLSNKDMTFKFYDIEESAKKILDIVEVMTPHFSSRPGTYYSDALFYISLGLYRIAPKSQQMAILLDCDLYFKQDISLLFKQFENFKSTALFGLAPELTPVYRHILHMYKAKRNTTFGEFYHKENIMNSTHPKGFQGYNSGVVLLNFNAQRKSKDFPIVIKNETVYNLTSKYRFRGHLGDQDFYTLLGYEYPHLIQTLHCGFNRQLCTWWRDHGYSKIFDQYFKCDHEIVVLHGNCNTRIPK